MQQATRRFVLLLGGTLLTASGLLVAACSTDNGEGGSSGLPTVEAGGGKDTGSSGNIDSGNPNTDGGTTTDPDCGLAPKLRDNTNGFFCAFVPRDAGTDATADGGNPQYCQNDQVCCNSGRNPADTTKFGASFCAPAGNKTNTSALNGSCDAYGTPNWFPDGGTLWACADKNGCGGKACCMFTAPGKTGVNVGKSLDKDIPAACNALQAFQQGGSHCSNDTTCAAGEIKLCSLSDSTCGAGTTCTPFEGSFRDLGYCK